MRTLLIIALLCSPAAADEWDSFLSEATPPARTFADVLASAAGDSHDYATHRRQMEATGRLVVLLTRPYCAPCESMKRRLDEMRIDYATVSYGDRPDLAVKIGSRGLTPELVAYDRIADKWQTRRLVGLQSHRTIREFLDTHAATMKAAAAGDVRLPGPQHRLSGTMCNSRNCQMCVGIALRNLGITPEGRSHQTWLAQYDNHFNGATVKKSFTVQDDRAPYGETPHDAIPELLDLAGVFPGSNVCDVGSGDGRIAIAAARRGAYATGVEIDADLVAEARANASGVPGVQFSQGNAIDHDYAGYDAIVCYLTPNVTTKMLPALRRCNDGTRIVCWEYPLEGVRPTTTRLVSGKTAYAYETPLELEARAARRQAATSCSGGACGRGLFGLFCRSCR